MNLFELSCDIQFDSNLTLVIYSGSLFVNYRKGSGNGGAIKKVIHAHVVPMTHSPIAANEKPDTGNDVKSSATSTDAVATAAVAAVLATQTFLKVILFYLIISQL